MNDSLEGFKSRPDQAEESISELKDKSFEIVESEEQNKEKRIKRKEDSLRDLRDNIKHNSICIVGVPEGEEREKGP